MLRYDLRQTRTSHKDRGEVDIEQLNADISYIGSSKSLSLFLQAIDVLHPRHWTSAEIRRSLMIVWLLSASLNARMDLLLRDVVLDCTWMPWSFAI